MKTITLPCKGLKDVIRGLMQLPLEHRDLAIIGKVGLKDVKDITDYTHIPTITPEGKVRMVRVDSEFATLDISKAEWGVETEEWFNGAYSHSGYVCFGSGEREVEVLRRMLERANARCVVLPAGAMRRHVNTAVANKGIHSLRVSDESPLFSMDGESLCNKKRTRVWFAPR